MLLVMDNAEHVVGAVADLVARGAGGGNQRRRVGDEP
jgi:hypothetical protein